MPDVPVTTSTDTENHETLNSGDGEAPYKAFSTRYRNYVLGLLTLGYRAAQRY